MGLREKLAKKKRGVTGKRVGASTPTPASAPAAPTPPVAAPPVAAPPVEYQNVHGLQEPFKKLVEERQEVHAEMEALKAVKEKLSEKIEKMLLKCGVTSAVVRLEQGDVGDVGGVSGWQVTVAKGKKPSEKIDEGLLQKRLLREGMTAEVIAEVVKESMVRGKQGEPHLVVTEIGAAG